MIESQAPANACNARRDLHTICRSFTEPSSDLGTEFCGGSRSAKRPLTTLTVSAARAVANASKDTDEYRRQRPENCINRLAECLSLQRLIDDREPLLALHEVDIGNAEQGAQLVVGDLHRAGRWRTAGRRQRERGSHGSVEGDIALHLLHHLMDVAIKDGDRTEALQQLDGTGAIAGPPAPFLIHRP